MDLGTESSDDPDGRNGLGAMTLDDLKLLGFHAIEESEENVKQRESKISVTYNVD